jgi:hypothetical protein
MRRASSLADGDRLDDHGSRLTWEGALRAPGMHDLLRLGAHRIFIRRAGVTASPSKPTTRGLGGFRGHPRAPGKCPDQSGKFVPFREDHRQVAVLTSARRCSEQTGTRPNATLSPCRRRRARLRRHLVPGASRPCRPEAGRKGGRRAVRGAASLSPRGPRGPRERTQPALFAYGIRSLCRHGTKPASAAPASCRVDAWSRARTRRAAPRRAPTEKCSLF